MQRIETYIWSEGHFLGKGKFNTMPRVGETIFPISFGDKNVTGKVIGIRNWNYGVELPWEGITVIDVVIEDKVKTEETMKLQK